MTRLITCCRRMVVVTLLLALPAAARAQDFEAVLEWNRLLQVTVASTATPTVFFTRPFALTSIAVFDAVNSIDKRYQPYLVSIDAAPGASRAAAAAQAAHDVLVALYPGQRATLDSALASTLNGLPPAAASEGVRVGAAAARASLDSRADDGWNRPVPEYLLPNLPGYYQVTPPQNAAVAFGHYPDVQPFAIGSRLQYLVGPPPALSSERYAADFNEVKAIGSITSTTRTDVQTSIARRWAGVNTTTTLQIVWNNVARDLSVRAGLSAVDAARVYALMNMAEHDALLSSFNGKFLYGLWRPVTAIRSAELDGNPATAADANWLPLITTPPYPSYPGNQACFAAASSRVLARIFGRDDLPLTVTWTGTAGNASITRSFSGLRQLADEQARSRIYAGIHFSFDTLASFGVCVPLADYVVENQLRPR
jgi:hypothetical protein